MEVSAKSSLVITGHWSLTWKSRTVEAADADGGEEVEKVEEVEDDEPVTKRSGDRRSQHRPRMASCFRLAIPPRK